jgi:Na+-translocating ferredoxin:NAD+ oxidoreductase RnfG subunit
VKTLAWSLAPLVVLSAPAPLYAAQYMTAEEALRHAFPQASEFRTMKPTLGIAQWQAIDQTYDAPVGAREPRAWVALADGKPVGYLYVDDVLGKQLMITYALALGLDARVQRVDILEYRETHGFEVRNARWLAQFNGKDLGNTLQLGEDIKNISGATLSCRHVTQGVRRLLAIHRAHIGA